MPNIGPLEIAIVLVIVLVIFGPKRLPELGKSMGRGIKEFKGSINSIGENKDDAEVRAEADAEPKKLEAAGSAPRRAALADHRLAGRLRGGAGALLLAEPPAA
jgi:sec-independent protein translocase protein TatA